VFPVDVSLLRGSCVNFSSIPDLAAVALLIGAFASVSKRNENPGSGLWLAGWCMIALHFAAQLFSQLPGFTGLYMGWISLSSLTWAAVLFMRATVPYRNQSSSVWMSGSMFVSNTVYLSVLVFQPAHSVLMVPAATLFFLLPAIVASFSLRKFRHSLRWLVLGLNLLLSLFLLQYQYRPGNGTTLAIHAVLFAAYFNCTLHFLYTCRKLTTGNFITLAGFASWSMVFVLAPLKAAWWPQIVIENEVWNLPKYVVAAAMILLMLERQIDHNRHLALHDELTGLPNRRLFQDRLNNALERARRNGHAVALLLIDLDRFKEVNDTLGHHTGDLLLRHVSALFLQRVRSSDTIARTGGDEFSVVLEEGILREDALHVARDLTLLLESPLDLAGQTVQAGASIGLAFYPEDAVTAEALCIAADLSMYKAKNERRQARPRLLAMRVATPAE